MAKYRLVCVCFLIICVPYYKALPKVLKQCFPKERSGGICSPSKAFICILCGPRTSLCILEALLPDSPCCVQCSLSAAVFTDIVLHLRTQSVVPKLTTSTSHPDCSCSSCKLQRPAFPGLVHSGSLASLETCEISSQLLCLRRNTWALVGFNVCYLCSP